MEGHTYIVEHSYNGQAFIPPPHPGYQGNFNYHYSSQSLPQVIQLVPVQYVMTTVPPKPPSEVKIFPYQPRGKARQILPNQSHSQNPQNQGQRQVADPIAFLKVAIYDCIKQSDMLPSPKRSDINLKSFLFGLSENKISLSVSAEVHLNWFIEFVCTRYRTDFHESLLDYFDYIKTFHIKPELERNSVKMTSVIESAIIKLIHHRCYVPDVIVQLVELVGKSMNPKSCDWLYSALLNSILTHQYSMSRSGMVRYMTTFESFLKHLRHIPFHITGINVGERSVSVLRIVCHFAHIYEILLGFRECTPEEIIHAFLRTKHYSNGAIMTSFAFERFRALEMILQKVVSRIIQSDKGNEIDMLLDRYELVANILKEYISFEDYKSFVTYRLNNLLDLYMYTSAMDQYYVLNFSKFVVMSYFGDTRDKFGSLCQVAICLSNYVITLDYFRASFKDDILFHGVDEEYVLVLEAIIAAVEDVVCESAEYLTWEPSLNFLKLQDEIIQKVNRDARNRYALLESPFLMLAAQIFLSRQTGYPISFFATTIVFRDGFAWTDAIDFINFFYDLIFPGLPKTLKVKSRFFNDVKSEFSRVPTLEEMFALHKLGNYENMKRYTEVESAENSSDSNQNISNSNENVSETNENTYING